MIDKLLQSQLREKFNPDGSDLRLYQKRLLNVLLDFDKYCAKHNIKYWICSGTLIGAVRHGGFIPWDDDIDVDMLYDDYKKLLKAVKKDIPKGYVLQIHKTDKNYIAQYAKFREINSVIDENDDKDRFYKYRGAYIDIFPLIRSYFLTSNYTSKIHSRIIRLSRSNNKILRSCLTPLCYNFLIYIFYPIINIFNSKSKFYRGLLGSGIIKTRDMSNIFPLSKIDFEGYSFPAPIDVDKYLKRIYGDYNDLPNLNTIKPHITNFKILND